MLAALDAIVAWYASPADECVHDDPLNIARAAIALATNQEAHG
jgi:hypothetical protein